MLSDWQHLVFSLITIVGLSVLWSVSLLVCYFILQINIWAKHYWDKYHQFVCCCVAVFGGEACLWHWVKILKIGIFLALSWTTNSQFQCVPSCRVYCRLMSHVTNTFLVHWQSLSTCISCYQMIILEQNLWVIVLFALLCCGTTSSHWSRLAAKRCYI